MSKTAQRDVMVSGIDAGRERSTPHDERDGIALEEPEQRFAAQRFAVVVLTGMAIEVDIVPELNDYSRELETVNDTLLALLSQALPR